MRMYFNKTMESSVPFGSIPSVASKIKFKYIRKFLDKKQTFRTKKKIFFLGGEERNIK